MEKVNEEKYLLSTGKEIWVNNGYIGLCIQNEYAKISTGYDDKLCTDAEEYHCDLNIDEQKEIAEHMIKEWTAYLDSLQ